MFKFPPYTLLLANKIVEVANYVGLDVIHAHYAIPHSISAFLAKQMMSRPLPLVTTLHGTDVTLVGAFEEFYELTRLALRASDRITAVSSALAGETEKTFGTRQQDIEVIPNFIDPKVYFPMEGVMTKCRKYFAPQGEKILAHISNFREVKRVVDVVNIFALVDKVIPCRLLLVGDGPEMKRVEQTVLKLGLEGKVQFLGKQESVQEILQMVDVFLLPSQQESFGLVALEAMACGVPVVASRVGGLPEVVQHGRTGFLAEVGDVVEMSRGVIRLLKDDLLYKTFSKQAVAWARETFPVDRAVRHYEDIYQEVISQRAETGEQKGKLIRAY